jgi:DNA-binding CsgD family transcriptional regulator
MSASTYLLPAPVALLSAGELRVLRLLALGLTQQEITRELYLSEARLASYTQRIYDRLGVRSRRAAVASGRALGLLP